MRNGDDGWNPFEDERRENDDVKDSSMPCNTEGCPILKHESAYCPVCKKDESGKDWSEQEREDMCDSLAAKQFEDWAHGGNQDDWNEDRSDPVVFNDAGEPLGYC